MLIDELQKAIDEAAMAGILMLRKSQMSFDFASTNPHHVAYTRTNASGTVSNIAAKGNERYKVVKLDNGRHGVKDTLYKYNVATGMDKEQAHAEAATRNTRHKEARAKEAAEEALLNAASQPAAEHPAKTAVRKWITASNAASDHYLDASPDERETKAFKREYSALIKHRDNKLKEVQKHANKMTDAEWHTATEGTDSDRKDFVTEQPTAKEAKKQKVWGGTDSADGKFRFRDWESGEEVPNYEGEYTYFSKDGGKSQMHTWIDKHGERNHSHMTKDEYNAKYGEDFGYTPHKVGDNVHLGFGTKGGAGYFGKLTKIDGETAYVTNDEGRTFKGHVSKLSAGK